MELALRTAQTALEAKRTDVNEIVNNISNASTTGFKKGRVEFADLPYQIIRQPGSQDTQDSELASGLMIGSGVKVASTHKIFEQGSQIQTNNQFDLFINGAGFLQVLTPTGEKAYTRDGHLQVDKDGKLLIATSNYAIEPPISVPEGATQVMIGRDGTISALVAGSTEPVEVGRIELANFINPAGLQPMGDNLYQATTASGEPQTGEPGGDTGLGTTVQGALESSNVDVIAEMVRLIEAQRENDVCAKGFKVADEMLQTVTRDVAA